MCGILGIHRGWLDDPERFTAALHALEWRGPDGVGQVEVGSWRLGVTRLAITDAEAPQPIRCADTGRVAVFNGADTLAPEEWERLGPGRTKNDAELLLRRAAAGEPVAPRAGHGAGAVVDPRTDEVALFQDPCGEKPLLVLERDGRPVAFASTVAALRQLTGVEVGLDLEGLGRTMRFGFHLGPKLSDPARDAVVLRHTHGNEIPAGQTPGPGAGRETGPRAGTAESVDTLLAAALTQASARCAQAEVPVAVTLSGGVDSACIAAALASRGTVLPAYQFRGRVVGDGLDRNERRRAQAVAAHLSMPLQLVDGGPEILDALPQLTAHVGLPLGDPSVLAAHALAQAARRDGHKVLLSGEGADEYWLGYRRYRLGQRLRRRWVPKGVSRWLPGMDPQLATSQSARVRRAMVAADPYAALLTVSPPGFLQTVLSQPSGDTDFLGIAPLPRGRVAALRRMAQLDQQGYLRWDLLPKLDTATMAAGVEGRCPFLDPAVRAVGDQAMQQPTSLLGKKALKRAFAPLLPAGFTKQRKRGLAVPLDHWLRAPANLLLDVLRDRGTQERPHLKDGGVARMLDLHRRDSADLGHALYLIAAVELWLRAGGVLVAP